MERKTRKGREAWRRSLLAFSLVASCCFVKRQQVPVKLFRSQERIVPNKTDTIYRSKEAHSRSATVVVISWHLLRLAEQEISYQLQSLCKGETRTSPGCSRKGTDNDCWRRVGILNDRRFSPQSSEQQHYVRPCSQRVCRGTAAEALAN